MIANKDQHTTSHRQRLFYLVMVFVAYLSTSGYGLFYWWVGADLFLVYNAGTAFFIFIFLGIFNYKTRYLVYLFRFGIIVVGTAFINQVINTGGLMSPAFPQLLIIPILSFFYKPRRDRFFFSSITLLIALLIAYLTFIDHPVIQNTIPEEYRMLHTFINYFFFTTVFIAFIFIFSFAVTNINQKLNDSLTELKNATQKLIDSEKMASLGQLMAGIAHEINNPVNYVKGCSNTLQDIMADQHKVEQTRMKSRKKLQAALDGSEFAKIFQKEVRKIEELENELGHQQSWPMIMEMLEAIDVGAQKTVNIINSLSFYSRKHKGYRKLYDINNTIDTSLKIVNHKIKEGINLKMELGNRIPLSMGNEGRLSQVILNLVVNAMDACEEEGEVVIKSSYMTAMSTIFVTVSDNGDGIPPDVRNKIFDPFFTTKDVGKGTGLGLSISKEIVEEHHGEILMETSKNGTTFTIRLPVIEDK